MPPTNLFGLGYGTGPAGYGYPSAGRWSPLSLGTSLAAWWPMLEGSGQVASNVAPHAAYSPSGNYLGAPEQNFATVVQLWEAANVTVTDNAGNNRHGNAVASRVVSTSGIHYLFQVGVTVPNGTQMTVSFDVKSNNGLAQKCAISADCGSFMTSADLDITTSWTRVSFTFTTGATTATIYIAVSDAAQDNDLDCLIWDARLELGATATESPESEWDLQLGDKWSADSKDPTWSSGLAWSSGSEKHAMGTAVPVPFSTITLYAVVKRSGSLFQAHYAPIFSDLLSGSAGHFLLAGEHASSYWPVFRFSTSTGDRTDAFLVNLDDGADHILAAVYDGSHLRMYLDGPTEVANKSIGAVGPFDLSRMFVGSFAFTGYWAGNIRTGLMVSDDHSPAQVAQVAAYLRSAMAARSVTVNTMANFVVFEGDSITSALGSPTGDLMYPYKAMRAITSKPQGRNLAVPGSVIRTGAGAPSLVDRLPDLDASIVAGQRTILVMADGHNDCAAGSFQSDYSAYIASAKALAAAKGATLKIICLTILPSSFVGLQADIDTANTFIRANSFGADTIVDIAVLTNMLDPTNLTYYSDGTHPTAAGHDEIYPSVQAAIEALLV